MTEQVHVLIGGKPYTFDLGKKRRVDGVTVSFDRDWSGTLRARLETRDFYGSRSDEQAQAAFDLVAKEFHDEAKRSVRSAGKREARARARTAADIRELQKSIVRAKSRLKREIASARANLPKVEARSAKALAAFGAK
jgi:hypothetical protein